MAIVDGELVRILCDQAHRGNVNDVLSGKPLEIWRGSDVTLQLGLRQAGQHLLSTDGGTIIVELKAPSAGANDSSLWRDDTLALEAGHTAQGWVDGDTYLAATTIDQETTQALSTGVYHLIVKREGTLMGTYLSSEIHVKEDYSQSDATAIFSETAASVPPTATNAERTSTAIPAGATSVTVSAPGGFEGTDLAGHFVQGPAGVVLGAVISQSAANAVIEIATPPAAAGTHTLEATFINI